MIPLRDLTDGEDALMQKLGDCLTDFRALDAAHPSDVGEFITHVHALQNIVLSRPGTEALRAHRR